IILRRIFWHQCFTYGVEWEPTSFSASEEGIPTFKRALNVCRVIAELIASTTFQGGNLVNIWLI
ncbi:hypothetical protein OFC56_35410, partial [Escherichia coli]|nr:hypothetical protein [Escherichia coli]